MKKINILIVEDSELNQRSLKLFLNTIIFNNIPALLSFSFAEDYASTRKKLATEKPDIIILDAQLDDKEEGEIFSYKLIPEFKKKNNNVIIVMCSSEAKSNDDGIKNGATYALDKNLINRNWTEQKTKEFREILFKKL